MVDRLATRLGVPLMRLLIGGWIVSAVCLLVGLGSVLTATVPTVGFVLFIVGVILSITVAVNLLRLRAGDSVRKPSS